MRSAFSLQIMLRSAWPCATATGSLPSIRGTVRTSPISTDVLPMAIEDKLRNEADVPQGPLKEPYALFVGGAFYANQSGIKWFVENVVPEVSIKTCIVGKGLEALRGELERDGKVEVVGAVDELGHWYRNAKVVIAPIFDGSGMKTKVAEALMYGKRIIGTREAFSGYEDGT